MTETTRDSAQSRRRRLFTRIGRATWCGVVLMPLLRAWPLAAAPGPRRCEETPASLASSLAERWRGLAEARNTLPPDVFEQRVLSALDDDMAVSTIVAAILEEARADLGENRRADFADALRTGLAHRLLTFLEASGGSGPLAIVPAETSREGDATALHYSVKTGKGDSKRLTLLVGVDGGNSCKVLDVTWDGDGLVKTYGKLAKDLTHDYSAEYMIAKVGDRDELVLEDFESTPVGELPVGWTWCDGDKDKEKPYRVREEDGNRYLEATDEGQSVILGREIRWDLDEYPYISFRVRVNEIPEGGDERYGEKVDSAAGLYVTYKKKMLGKIPESVKFVWSSTLPVGSATIREGIGRPWNVVIGSGEDGLGEWRTYVFDLRDAYKKTFRGGPGHRPEGVGILSDANSTHSKAYADYDDIRVLRTAGPDVTGGVEKLLWPKRRRQ